MMIKMTDGDSFENNRSLIQELTFTSLSKEMSLRQLEFSNVQMKNLAAMLGASQPRNEKLASLFYRMKLIEAYGTGISKIISCYKGLPVQPKFENVEGAFRVILPNIHAQSLSAVEERYLPVLQLFEKQKEITRSDVEEALGVGTTHAVNTLKEMLSKDLIKKVGSGRLTRYVVK